MVLCCEYGTVGWSKGGTLMSKTSPLVLITSCFRTNSAMSKFLMTRIDLGTHRTEFRKFYHWSLCSCYKNNENGAWAAMVMCFELNRPSSLRSIRVIKFWTHGKIYSEIWSDSDRRSCFLTTVDQLTIKTLD